MNLRIVTLCGGCLLALAIRPLLATAEQRVMAATPLRGSALADALESEVQLFARPAEQVTSPRTPPDLWRNPGTLRSPAALDRPGVPLPRSDAVTSADPVESEAHPSAGVQTPRTLIQRIRERRLAQLERQAERLREMSHRDGPLASGTLRNADPNGPENLDLQIDLGVPTDAPSDAEEYLPLIGPAAAAEEPQPARTQDHPNREAESGRSDSDPAAGASIEIHIDLPDDGEPPASRSATQNRLRNLRGVPLR